jgi:ankyrin repeat domain-containing protein 50
MSGVLAKFSQLKPEIRLAQAVSQFEADLSNEQKTAFRSYRSQSLDSPPVPSDVMRLTAEIDRRVSGKGGGRCFGPRFTNFLQVVQQFAALGDVVVGGSQNIVACGVWSLVRMTFLVSGLKHYRFIYLCLYSQSETSCRISTNCRISS